MLLLLKLSLVDGYAIHVTVRAVAALNRIRVTFYTGAGSEVMGVRSAQGCLDVNVLWYWPALLPLEDGPLAQPTCRGPLSLQNMFKASWHFMCSGAGTSAEY